MVLRLSTEVIIENENEKYEKNSLELPLFKTYEERIDYLEDKLFSNESANQYYGFDASKITKEKYNDIVERWIGIKVMGKPHPMEHTKSILSYLAGYLSNARDNRIKDILKENQAMIDFGKDKNCIYKDRDVVFYVNIAQEKMLKNRLKTIKDDFMKKDIKKRLDVCKTSKKECVRNLKKIIKLSKDIRKINDRLSNELNKDKVQAMCKQINQNKKDIVYLKKQNSLLYDDYYVATEFLIKN